MGLILLTAFVVLSSLLVLFLHGRMNERAAWRDWTTLLEGRSQAIYKTARERIDDRLALVDCAYDQAFEAQKAGSIDEAIEFLDVGYDMVEAVAPDLRRLLAGMAVLSRMASAIAPVPPLRAADFRTANIGNLVQVQGILHAFLVSSKERFRLRIFVLSRAFTLVTRWLFLWTRRIRGSKTLDVGPWGEVSALHHDFRRLSDESLESLRVLLLSVAPLPPGQGRKGIPPSP